MNQDILAEENNTLSAMGLSLLNHILCMEVKVESPGFVYALNLGAGQERTDSECCVTWGLVCLAKRCEEINHSAFVFGKGPSFDCPCLLHVLPSLCISFYPGSQGPRQGLMWPQTYCSARDALELLIFLLLPPEGWDCRLCHNVQLFCGSGIEAQALCVIGRHSVSRAVSSLSACL